MPILNFWCPLVNLKRTFFFLMGMATKLGVPEKALPKYNKYLASVLTPTTRVQIAIGVCIACSSEVYVINSAKMRVQL